MNIFWNNFNGILPCCTIHLSSKQKIKFQTKISAFVSKITQLIVNLAAKLNCKHVFDFLEISILANCILQFSTELIAKKYYLSLKQAYLLLLIKKMSLLVEVSPKASINYATATKHSLVHICTHTYVHIIYTDICREYPSWLACKVVNKL